MAKAMNQRQDNLSGSKKAKIMFAVSAVMIALLLIYIGISVYFQNRFYFGSVINENKVSGMTVAEVEELLKENIGKYKLTLEERNDRTEQIEGEAIGLAFVSDGKIQELKDSQNPFAWPAALFSSKKYDMAATVTYDEEQLSIVYNGLEAFHEDKVTAPVNAYHEYSEAEGKFVIAAENNGNLVKKDVLYELVKEAVSNGETVLSLEAQDCYESPQYTVDSPEIADTLDALNKYMGIEIIYEFGDEKEVVNGDLLHSWLTVNENFEVALDEEKVREFVETIGTKYNTYGMARPFRTSGGQDITVTGGDYGWWMNRPEEAQELYNKIMAGESGVKEPVYYRKAASYEYPDYGNTYVEISINAQHMWFYKNGELLVDTPVVTGNPYKEGWATPTGAYGITYKERGATLSGENYSRPVDLWLPFYFNVGIHDAPWKSSFGGSVYKTQGSHGCVNTPYNAAKIIYDNIEAGDAVIVY